MVATRHEAPFSGDGWIFERELDDERCPAFRDGDRVRLRSRNRTALEPVYPELVEAVVVQLPADPGIFRRLAQNPIRGASSTTPWRA